MTRVAAIYPTFGRGEVSPHIYGRIDIDQYPSCLEKARNVWIRPYGEASRVPGTKYVNEAKVNTKVRFLKFVFSATDSYIIECGAGYFRFYRDGALINVTTSDLTAWATSTSYVVGNFVQQNDLAYYCVEAHTSGTFATDLEAGKWVRQDIYEIPNDYTVDQLDSIQSVQIDDIIKLVCVRHGTDNATNRPKELLRYSDTNWVFRDVTFICTPFLEDNVTSTTLLASATTGTITVTASTPIFNAQHVGSFWKIGGTVTEDDVKSQGYVKITAFTNTTTVAASVQSTLSGTTATDNWAEGAWSDYRGYPTRIGLFDGRLYYARTEYSKRNVYGSKPYAYESFKYAVDNEDNGAINVELATNATGDGSDIKWLIGSNYILAGTYGGEFVIKGEGDSAITPSNITARQRSNMGSEAVSPVMVGSYIHFIQRNGKKLRQFTYDYYTESYNSVDMSLFSEHLFDSPVIDIAYAKSPDGVVYLLREDGNIIAFTYDAEQQVQAWALIESTGKVESIEVIPSSDGNYDELWMAVRRTINGSEVIYVETMGSLITPSVQQDCWYVRSGLDYSAYDQTKGTNLTLSAKTGTITATASGNYFTSAMVGRKIRYFDGEVLGQATITEYTSATVVTCSVEYDFSTTSISGGKWGISVTSISGLSHLEGKTVQVLADGAVRPDEVVTSGAFDLASPAWRVIAGLGYRSYIKTLPLEQGAQNGTSVGKRKRVNELSVRVWRTLGIKVGKDLETLQQIQFRNPTTKMGLPEEMFSGIIPNVKYNQGWTWESCLVLEQSNPLPMNVLALAPICNEQDK